LGRSHSRFPSAYQVLLILLPLVPVAYDIVVTGINAPFVDQWGVSYRIAVLTQDGQLTLNELLYSLGDHILFFNNLVTMLSTLWFGWNLHYELIVNFVTAFLILALLGFSFLKTQGNRRWWILIIAAILIFSFRSRLSFLYSLQSGYWFNDFFAVLCALLLIHRRAAFSTLCLILLFAFCGALSSSGGLVVLGIIPLFMLLLGYRKVRDYVLWGFCVAAIVVFFFSYRTSNVWGADPVSTILQQPLQALAFVLVWVGSVFGRETIPAFVSGIFGFVLLGLNLYLYHKSETPWRTIALPLFLIAYGLGLGIVTAFTRTQLGLLEVTAERFSVYSITFWVGLVLLIAVNFDSPSQQIMQIAASMWLRRSTYWNAAGLTVLLLLQARVTYTFLIELPPTVNPTIESCVANLAVFRDSEADCLNWFMLDGSARERVFQPVSNSLLARSLTQFHDDTLVIDLSLAHLRLSEGTLPQNVSVHSYWYPINQYIFAHAPSSLGIPMTLPKSYTRAIFSNRVTVQEPPGSEASVSRDGVDFTVLIQQANAEVLLVTTTIDPRSPFLEELITADLTPFIGQTVTLILRTGVRTNTEYDWSTWNQPRIVLSRS